MTNKYSALKLAWFPTKLEALSTGTVTAPIYVRIKPTNRCFMHCPWCVYRYGGVMHRDSNLADEIPAGRLLEIIHDLSALGVKAITFSGGGEPLSHAAFADACREVLACGMDLSVITNGYMLHGDDLHVLLDAKWVRVSVDYWNADSFYKSRGMKPWCFDHIENNLNYFAGLKHNELTANFIVTHENAAHISDACRWLRDVGCDNVRISPVWVDDIHAYHADIKEIVESEINSARELENMRFKVYSSFPPAPDCKKRPTCRCWFQQIVPVIGADMNVYACQNQSYNADCCLGSIADRSFGDLWFDVATKVFFDTFNPQERCDGIQCAADGKNKFYGELLAAKGDNFV